jgi:uncharacterized membrane protein YccC
MAASGRSFGEILQSMKDELLPYPGRAATVVRMVVATAITMLIVMGFQMPGAALGVFYVLVLSRESTRVTVRDGLNILAANAAGIALLLAGINLFGDYPLTHFLFVSLSFFLVFFVTRTFRSYSLAFGFSIVTAAALSIWDRPYPAYLHTRDTLWVGFGIVTGTLVTMATELAFQTVTGTREENAPAGLFIDDAFSNPAYVRYALKGCLAATICYIVYSALDWPGISVCTTTCIITTPMFNTKSPMYFIGSATQRLALRLSGSFTGGVILGIGSQVFLLPFLDITGLTILFIAFTSVAAWFATSGPGLSYYGRQMALAFYLTMFQTFGIRDSLAASRDRVIGIWLGLWVMWLVFDAGRGAPIRTAQTSSVSVTN